MENKNCILCSNMHNDNWVVIPEENRKGYVCDDCYEMYAEQYDLCIKCNAVLSYKNMSHKDSIKCLDC